MKYLLGLLALIAGGFGFFLSRRKDDEINAQNEKVKDTLKDLQSQVDSNNTSLSAEEEKRKAIESSAQEEENKNVTEQDLLDFLNKPNK